MGRRRLVASAGALAAAAMVVVAASTPAAAAPPQEATRTATLTVGVSSDAWYRTMPGCGVAHAACLLPAPTPPYPAKTLHVGVAGGQEESRTYLALDVSDIPADASLTGGRLVLPVGSSDDGSRMPADALFVACLASEEFEDDVEGGVEEPPALDCANASAPAVYVAATGTAPAVFTVDLTTFAAAWAVQDVPPRIALVPSKYATTASAWHVALSAHDREAPAAQVPRATITYEESLPLVALDGGADTTVSQGFTPPLIESGSGAPPSTSFLGPQVERPIELNAPTVASELPAVAPDVAPAAPATAVQPQAFAGVPRFPYPGAFLLPLLFAVAGMWVARQLTRDLAAPRTRLPVIA